MKRRDFFKHLQKKRYEAGAYSNPYFKRKKASNLRGTILFIFVFIIIAVITILLLVHPALSINKVRVDGIQFISKDSIQSIVGEYLNENKMFVLPNHNLFLFSKDVLKERLETSFTFADLSIYTDKKTLFIELTERTSELLWQIGDDTYVVDLEGIVIRKISNEELVLINTPIESGGVVTKIQTLPVFVDVNKIDVTIGHPVLKEEEIESTLRFHKHLTRQGIEFTITQFDRIAGKLVAIDTTEGFQILFDPLGDIDAQARRLDALLRENVSDLSSLRYVDLRFGDHVYFQ